MSNIARFFYFFRLEFRLTCRSEEKNNYQI
jgi:hypothetical protein